MGFANIDTKKADVSQTPRKENIDYDRVIPLESKEAPKERADTARLDYDRLKGIGSDIRDAADNAIFEARKALDTRETAYEDRISRTPGEMSRRVEFVGRRGDSLAVPKTNTVEGRALAADLKKLGVRGIHYSLGYPDFSPVAKETVRIEGMGENRLSTSEIVGNYEKADVALAGQWNERKHEGRDDWSAREVKAYRKGSELTWHEKEDLKTMQLIPTAIHEAYRHSGGVAEYKNRNDIASQGAR